MYSIIQKIYEKNNKILKEGLKNVLNGADVSTLTVLAQILPFNSKQLSSRIDFMNEIGKGIDNNYHKWILDLLRKIKNVDEENSKVELEKISEISKNLVIKSREIAKKYNKNFDYSINELEYVLNIIKNDYKRGIIKDEQVYSYAEALGYYLGIVILKNNLLNCRWTLWHGNNATIKNEQPCILGKKYYFPIDKVYKYIINSEVESIYDFYKLCIKEESNKELTNSDITKQNLDDICNRIQNKAEYETFEKIKRESWKSLTGLKLIIVGLTFIIFDIFFYWLIWTQYKMK